MPDDADKALDDYYTEKRANRAHEANGMWQRMAKNEVDCTTFLEFDFRHFGDDESGIRALADQLSENYKVTIKQHPEQEGYWLLDGTTRPEGIDGMDAQRLTTWVEFMCDVSQSHGCVFSTWRLTDTKRSLDWSNDTDSI